MEAIDDFDPAIRALVYEFGFVIVQALLDEGERRPEMLRHYLESWRDRRQDELLKKNYQIDRQRMLAIASRYRPSRRHRDMRRAASTY